MCRGSLLRTCPIILITNYFLILQGVKVAGASLQLSDAEESARREYGLCLVSLRQDQWLWQMSLFDACGICLDSCLQRRPLGSRNEAVVPADGMTDVRFWRFPFGTGGLTHRQQGRGRASQPGCSVDTTLVMPTAASSAIAASRRTRLSTLTPFSAPKRDRRRPTAPVALFCTSQSPR